MKIIKNTCYGGYSLSVAAKIEIAKRKGKEIYFFDSSKQPLTKEEAQVSFFAIEYTVPNPYELGIDQIGEDGTYKKANEISREISINFDDRTDPDIISVVEELGDAANGSYAHLTVVEIPDGIEYEIDEYDGFETIREIHRTW